MSKVKFEREVREAKLLSPIEDYKLAVNPLEFRKDPLTDRWCRINIERAKRVKQAKAEASDAFTKVVEESKKKCFFCPESIEKSTPKFPEDFPAPRMKAGSACLFPNLFPFGEFHAIGVFSGEHYLELDQFPLALIKDCLGVCLEYFRFVYEKHPDIKYSLINWNCLPPAAASIIHPHVQILADYKPTPVLEELLDASEQYREKNGSNYWRDLIETERGGERWIGETGSVSWLTSFAPQGNKEVLAVFTGGPSNALQVGDQDLADFCDGLSRVLKGYHGIGVTSFNMSVFSGPNDRDSNDSYLLNAKLVSRPNFEPMYTGDDGFMEKLHSEPVIEARPEDIAEKIREQF